MALKSWRGSVLSPVRDQGLQMRVGAKLTAGVLGALASLALVGQAGAVTITGVYSGTVSSGTDITGVFGPAGSDLTGDPFSVTVTMDSDFATSTYPGGVSVAGGPITASLTIDGTTVTRTDFSLGGAFSALITYGAGGPVVGATSSMTVFGDTTFDVVGPTFYYYDVANGVIIPPTGSTMQSSGPVFSGTSDGSECSSTNGDFCGGFNLYGEAAGEFRTTAFSINMAPTTIAGPLPEPSAWILMILGFGGLGGALRRRSGLRPSMAA